MSVIPIATSRPYNVHIARDILPQLGSHLARMHHSCTVAVISDDIVFSLYGRTVCASLTAAGFHVVHYVLPHGEEHKNLQTYGQVLEFLAREHLTRSDLLCALGGGVVGDLTGFAAATYLRGLPYVQIPTTLLSAVDSSVGGKTAVDLSIGKNLAGAFWQPVLVWCDLDVLDSLPPAVFRDGCAEIIKYGLLGDADFFHRLDQTPIHNQLEAVVDRSVTMKRDIVIQDERDTGERQKLNLGHTFGHAIESASGYHLSHGHCVAMGMAIVTRAAAHLGYCPAETPQTVTALLDKYGLPSASPYGPEILAQAALSDKKMDGAALRLVVPRAVGRCELVTVPAAEIPAWLHAGGVL